MFQTWETGNRNHIWYISAVGVFLYEAFPANRHTRHQGRLRGKKLTCTTSGKRMCPNSWRHASCPCKGRLCSASDTFSNFIRLQSFFFAYSLEKPAFVFVNCSQCRLSRNVEPLTGKKQKTNSFPQFCRRSKPSSWIRAYIIAARVCGRGEGRSSCELLYQPYYVERRSFTVRDLSVHRGAETSGEISGTSS